jgi:hypothetical protein
VPELKVKISKSAPLPRLDITVGHEHWGKYRAIVWNPTGFNLERDIEGTTVDGIPDRFPLADTVEELANRILTVELAIVSYEEIAGEPYTAKLRILQGTKVAEGGLQPFDGNLNEYGAVGRVARFRFQVVA